MPTVSVSASWPTPFGTFSIAGNMGNRASSGIYVNAPTRDAYYKLWITKEYRCQPFVVYQVEKRSGKKTLYYKGMSKVHISTIASAKKV